MLDVMFDTPTDNSIEKVIVPEKYIVDRSTNIQIIRKEKPIKKASGENN